MGGLQAVSLLLLAGLAVLAPAGGRAAPPEGPPARRGYLDALPRSQATRSVEAGPEGAYTHAIRAAATYQCPYFGGDGALRTVRRPVVAYGTGFAFRREGGGTLLLTNRHVVEWPAATDAEHAVEGVPAGCRRTEERLSLVDGETDDDESDDTHVVPVVVDHRLDLAVVRAPVALPILPWRVGRSELLRPRDAVVVVGFPLGRLYAVNVGKVIAVHDHDGERGWDHDDFVVDALLSQGNSGSPVLAFSAATGAPELVGVYHAAYARGTALNVVVSIDQARGLMERLEASTPPRVAPLDAAKLARLAELARRVPLPAFPFGTRSALVRVRPDGGLVYQLVPEDFPLRAGPQLVLAGGRSCRADGRAVPIEVWIGGRRGLVLVPPERLDGAARRLLDEVLAAMQADAAVALELRLLEAEGDEAAPRAAEQGRLERELRQAVGRRRELLRATLDLVERLGRASGDAVVSVDAAVAGELAGAACAPAHREVATGR